jgi:hypothetical protein
VVVGTSPITGSCTSGFTLFNNGGVVGCQANASGGAGVVNVISNSIQNLVCDNATDDTAALNALIAGVVAAGSPGTLYFPKICKVSSGEIVFPNTPGTPLRFTGAAVQGNYQGLPLSFGGLNMTFNAPLGKIDARFIGTLEIDHMVLEDTGADCAPFIFTTNTVLKIHETSFIGTASGYSACNTAIIYGGTNPANQSTFLPDAAFAGYGTRVWNNVFSKVSIIGLYQTFANGILFDHNTIDNTNGSGVQTAITAATNANPAVLTITGHGWPATFTANPGVPVVVQLQITGATGSWAPINGGHPATVIDANTVSIPINSTAFGALTGSPKFYSGSMIVFNGGTNIDGGNSIVDNNPIELGTYGYFIDIVKGSFNYISDNILFDFNTISFIRVEAGASSQHTFIHPGYSPSAGAPLVVGPGSTANMQIVDYSGSSQGTQLGFGIGNAGLFLNENVLVSGRMGIGSLDQNSLFNINVQLADPTAQTQALFVTRSVSLTANNAQPMYGANFSINMAASAFNATGVVAGHTNAVSSANTGTVAEADGGIGFVYNTSTGTMTLANGFRSYLQNLNAAGHITTFNGFLADVGPGFNLGVVTNWNGFNCGTPPPSVTTPFCFFEPGTTPNKLGGQLQAAGLISSADPGGTASTNTVSSVSSSTISTGVGSIKMSTANPATNTSWIKAYCGTAVCWIPAFVTNAP